jgi:hypothetical protein
MVDSNQENYLFTYYRLLEAAEVTRKEAKVRFWKAEEAGEFATRGTSPAVI